MTILLVDDESAQRLLMAELLELEGFTVVPAENGEDALLKLATAKFDLILSDVYMPIMDGIKLHKMVRETPGMELLPFLFISGNDDQLTRDSVKQPKIEGFLKKGFTIESLKKWITYLTTPLEKRLTQMPPQTSSLPPVDRSRDRPRTSR